MSDLRVPLETSDAALLIRFEDARPGQLEKSDKPIYAELAPPPEKCVERLLLQEFAVAKRRRLSAGVAAGSIESLATSQSASSASAKEAACERIRVLQEAQQASLQGARRAVDVAQLLTQRDWGSEQIRFLALHKAAPKQVTVDQMRLLTAEAAEASAVRPAEIRSMIALVPEELASERALSEYESALRFLCPYWPIQAVGGRYAVEIWTGGQYYQARLKAPSAKKPPKGVELLPKSFTHRQLVFLEFSSQLGVCLKFSSEARLLLESPQRLSVDVRPLKAVGTAANEAAVSQPEVSRQNIGTSRIHDPSLSRNEALHQVLLEAARFFAESAAFLLLKQSLLTVELASEKRKGQALKNSSWQLLRVGTSEVSLVAPMDDGRELLAVSVRQEPVSTLSTSEAGKSDEAEKLWLWVSELATLQLRHLSLERCKAEADVTTATESCQDFFLAFERWANPRLEAVARYCRSRGTNP
eukprot:TRINITY_DN3769_c0_g1_i1.p1 TRINITY_DN3769_c0_g1~~TRINITY_DN3769_c0_g1_i1.p1  ORF type:complete len:472 (-),score=98.06 TRINITY_DN3769_c0_g1_i1:347-1762(-)